MARRIIGCILRNKKQVKSNQPDIIKMGNTSNKSKLPTPLKTENKEVVTHHIKFGCLKGEWRVLYPKNIQMCTLHLESTEKKLIINGDTEIKIPNDDGSFRYIFTGTGNGDDTMSNCICTYPEENIACHGIMPPYTYKTPLFPPMKYNLVTKIIYNKTGITAIGSFDSNFLPDGKCTITYPDKTQITCIFSNGITFYKGKLMKYDGTILGEVDESKTDENNTDEIKTDENKTDE